MRSHRNRRVAAAPIGSVALVLPACGGEEASSAAPEPAQSEPASEESSTPEESGADPFALTREAAGHMPMTAMALTDGIDHAADLAGSPHDQASEVRALLNAKLTEHVYLEAGRLLSRHSCHACGTYRRSRGDAAVGTCRTRD